MDKKQYVWSFNKAGVESAWYTPTYKSIEDCIKEAKERLKTEKWDVNCIYVGEFRWRDFSELVDECYFAPSALHITQKCACDVEPSLLYWLEDVKRQEEYRKERLELNTKILEVIKEWLRSINKIPQVYIIENIQKVSLEDE